MPKGKGWSKALGEMVTRLWDTVERLQFHVYDLHDRLEAVEPH